MIRTVSTAALAAALAACATTEPSPPPTPVAAVPEETMMSQEQAHEELFALFQRSDEDSLRRNPISALFRGDMRYADQLGNYLTDEYYDAERAAAEAELAALREIPREALSETDQLAYDVFEYQKKQSIAGLVDELVALQVVRPVNHFQGFHTFYPVLASGQGAAPFNTVEDYENNLKRHAQFVELTDRAIARFREGLESGVLETKLTINNVIGQLDTQLAQPVKDTPYYAPARNFPEDFSEADKARLAAEYERVIEEDIFPAYRRLRDFLADEYVDNARDEVGLSSMKGGEMLYRQFIEDTTTLPLDPAYIHDLGLSEVARITAEMEAIKQEVGFDGTLQEFFTFIREDPQFKPPSREWLTEKYYEIGEQVDQTIDTQFSLTPKSPLEIRPVEPFREKNAAGGSYNSGTPDGSRPGVFYFNAYNLPERLTPGMETLYLHEGAPGHHFQISLAQENADLPNFMRFGGNTAFVEGWALYAETLGSELGLFTDPYQRFGHLNDEMLRAMRLVVDTGLHSKGWTRDQSIQYMLDNSGMTETEAISEVERYIAIPSQAVAYKIGALKIQELKAKAQQALGARFDPREFHAQILNTGALPLPILERKIDDWIASKG
ncbi:DUF885 domain-containing protein [Pacificimonas flava]|uniref:DUF885 domain-containing protein n=2 Tax=Pacificimonas TaxID=1960290 RepID=A0A219B2Y2_9SPHN|nr:MULTISPECIES: DUF885 domain-containing protein [Pacificimonas]MBZ6378193.1 DUF885 domain-containing protein [Pacificimonas aurantium]OWV32179.1 DUF885 domain-containing protein [Pacificimonas flava]